MSSPSRFSKGVTNVASDNPMGQLLIPDPTSVHLYFNDFDTYASGDWTVTNASGGSVANTDADGGQLLITNGAGNANYISMQLKKESFTFESGRKLWLKKRLILSDATLTACAVGLCVTDTSIIDSAPSDAVYFLKPTGGTSWHFTILASSATVSDNAGIGTATTNAVTLAAYFDGVSNFDYYFNGSKIGTVTTTAYPTGALNVTFEIENGEAVSKTLKMDYFMAAKERP